VFTRQKLLNLVTLVRHYKNESTFFDSTNVLEHVSCLSWTVPTFDEAAPPSFENITVALCLRDHRYRHLDKKKKLSKFLHLVQMSDGPLDDRRELIVGWNYYFYMGNVGGCALDAVSSVHVPHRPSLKLT
jgi:hypothetical protein